MPENWGQNKQKNGSMCRKGIEIHTHTVLSNINILSFTLNIISVGLGSRISVTALSICNCL